MKILNFDALNKTKQREIALTIAECGLQAIDTKNVIKEQVGFHDGILVVSSREFSLEKTRNLIIIGIGKCAIDAVFSLSEIIGEKITRGLVLDVRENTKGNSPANIEFLTGSHPLPSDVNVSATKKIISLLSGLSQDDLVIFVISGGGSTLLCLPKKGGTCIDEKTILEELVATAAPIHEVNTLRKHMSLARGGYLAQYAYPATVISLIFSDVPGNDIGFIASGPTVRDTTTIKDASAIITKYDLLKKCGLKKFDLVETPKDDKYFKNVYNTVVVSNDKALVAMENEASRFGYKGLVCNNSLVGEARDIGEQILDDISKASPKTILLYGGETTVTLRQLPPMIENNRRGGRNQELALSSLRHIGDELILSLASDGHDNGEYAGAVADLLTKQKAASMKLKIENYLRRNDATTFFEKTGDLIETGNTGSNVSDIIIAIK